MKTGRKIVILDGFYGKSRRFKLGWAEGLQGILQFTTGRRLI